MMDVMEQLRAAQPMPRGERLKHARQGRPWYAAELALARERRRRERAEMNAKVLKSALSATDGMFHEAMARVQFAMADMAVAMSKTFAAWTFDHERACRMERDGVLTRRVWRLVTKRMTKPPTREEVERAVDEVIRTAREWYEAVDTVTAEAPEEVAAAMAARAALVKLATRGT